jgi:hypothetical protein
MLIKSHVAVGRLPSGKVVGMSGEGAANSGRCGQIVCVEGGRRGGAVRCALVVES